MADLEAGAKRILHESWEKIRKIRGQADLEAEIYRTAVDNMEKLANSKGEYLRMAASSAEEAAEEKVQKLKEDTNHRYQEEEGKV